MVTVPVRMASWRGVVRSFRRSSVDSLLTGHTVARSGMDTLPWSWRRNRQQSHPRTNGSEDALAVAQVATRGAVTATDASVTRKAGWSGADLHLAQSGYAEPIVSM
jgi:hypothetical protein